MQARLRDTENDGPAALFNNDNAWSSEMKCAPDEDYDCSMEEAPSRAFKNGDIDESAIHPPTVSPFPHKNDVNEQPTRRIENKPDKEYLDQMKPKGYEDNCVYSYGMAGKILLTRLPLKDPYEEKLQAHILQLKGKIIRKLKVYQNGDEKKLRKY